MAGRQFVQLSAGLQGEGANGLPADVRLQGLQGVFEIAAERGVQAVQGRQRLCYVAPGRGAVGDGEARSKAASIAQVAVEGVCVGDKGVGQAVAGGVRRQGLGGVPEQVAGGRGEDGEAGGIVRVRGGAKGIGQQAAREGVDALRPPDGGQHLHPVGVAGDLDDDLKLAAGHLKANAETAPAGGRPGRSFDKPILNPERSRRIRTLQASGGGGSFDKLRSGAARRREP